MNTLELRDLQASIGGSRILRGVSFDVPEKSVFCLMGRNGVGKTSTLRSIVGLLSSEDGSIKLDGADLQNLRPEDRARLGLGYVPQGREIFPHLTVEENLHIGPISRGRRVNGGLERCDGFVGDIEAGHQAQHRRIAGSADQQSTFEPMALERRGGPVGTHAEQQAFALHPGDHLARQRLLEPRTDLGRALRQFLIADHGDGLDQRRHRQRAATESAAEIARLDRCGALGEHLADRSGVRIDRA